MQDKIEFQLILYKIVKDTLSIHDGLNDFPIKNIITPVADNNFFVNISSSDYQNTLKNGVKKLLPQSDIKTSFEVSFDGNINRTDSNKIFASMNDTLNFYVNNIQDDDSRLDQIELKIKVIPANKLSNSSYSISQAGDNTFKINFNTPGNYKIFVSSFDGISFSYSDTFNFEVANIPRILPLTEEKRSIHVENFWRPRDYAIYVPIFVLGEDPGFAFKFDYKEHWKPLRKIIQDSLNTFNNSFFIPIEDTSLIQYFQNSVPFTKKISQNLYSIGVFPKDFPNDSLINIFGVINGLKSNTENIKIEDIQLGFLSYQVELGFNTFKIEKNDCNCGTDSSAIFRYASIDPLKLRFKIFSIQNFSLGLSGSAGFILNTSKNTTTFNPFNDIKGMTENFNVFISKPFLVNNLIFDFSMAANAKLVPISIEKRNPYNQYGHISGYFVYGVNSQLNISTVKTKKFSFLINGSFAWGKSAGVKYNLSTVGAGLSFSPL